MQETRVRSLEGGNGSPLQRPGLENPTDGGSWWAAVPGVTESWTRQHSGPLQSKPMTRIGKEEARRSAEHGLRVRRDPSGGWGLARVSSKLLLLSRFGRVRLCATGGQQPPRVPLPTGFSRQEHWSGLPLPSPCRL